METTESLEQMQARHRKEAKELQGKITQKKKQASKKTRKGVNDESERHESELKERQVAEIAALNGTNDVPELESDTGSVAGEAAVEDVDREVERMSEEVKKVSFAEGSAPLRSSAEVTGESIPELGGLGKKRNRQKERLARRAAEQEAEAIKAEAEAASQPNWRKQERTAMLAAFAQHQLEEKEIRPDGHCLYSSIADQLVEHGTDLGAQNEAEKSETFRYKPVRRAAAMYILEHKDEFEGFLEEPLVSYVTKVERTAEWGGHLELVALAKSYNIQINVLQDGKVDRIGPEKEDEEPKQIWLAYYHHGYGLGEHYNSLRRKKGVDAAEEKAAKENGKEAES